MCRRTALVVLSYDGNSDLWETFFSILNTYWPDNPFPVYLVTNNATPLFIDVEVITTGNELSWSKTVRDAISQVKEQKIILLLEDYFLTERVDNSKLLRLLDAIDSQSIDYLRLVPRPRVRGREKNLLGIYPLPEDGIYGINLQPAIWNKDFLLKALGEDNYSAWEFENRQKVYSKYRIKGDCRTLKYPAISVLNGVVQGKWYRRSLKIMKKNGINIETGKRPIMTIGQSMRLTMKIRMAQLIPPRLLRGLKHRLKEMGFRFVIDD